MNIFKLKFNILRTERKRMQNNIIKNTNRGDRDD